MPHLVTALLVCLLSVSAWADSLPPLPKRFAYASADQRFRLEVAPHTYMPEQATRRTPAPEGGSLEITTRREWGKSQQIVTTRRTDARGRLVAVTMEVQGLSRDGAELRLVDTRAGKKAAPRWTLQVEHTPRMAVISGSGRYVATFDRWRNIGRNPDTIVLYGPEGRLVRRLELKDFLSEEERARLPRGSSNTYWAGIEGIPTHRIDEKQGVLIVRVATTAQPPVYSEQYMEKRISLTTGEVLP